MNRINRVDGARGAAALHRAPHVPSSDVSGGAQTTLRGPITRATQRHTYGPPLSLLPAAALVVVARGARRRLDALLDGGLVVPLVVQLAAHLLAENLERLAEQLEVRLGLGRRLGALRVLVGVPAPPRAPDTRVRAGRQLRCAKSTLHECGAHHSSARCLYAPLISTTEATEGTPSSA